MDTIKSSCSNLTAKGKYDTIHAFNNAVLRVMPGREADLVGSRAKAIRELIEDYLICYGANGRVRRKSNALILTLATANRWFLPAILLH
jgi:hypothetical protein